MSASGNQGVEPETEASETSRKRNNHTGLNGVYWSSVENDLPPKRRKRPSRPPDYEYLERPNPARIHQINTVARSHRKPRKVKSESASLSSNEVSDTAIQTSPGLESGDMCDDKEKFALRLSLVKKVRVTPTVSQVLPPSSTLPPPSTSSLLMDEDEQHITSLTSSWSRREDNSNRLISKKVSTPQNRPVQGKIMTAKTPSSKNVTVLLPTPSTSSLLAGDELTGNRSTSSWCRGEEISTKMIAKKANVIKEVATSNNRPERKITISELPSSDNVKTLFLAPSTSSLLMAGDEHTRNSSMTSSWCRKEEKGTEPMAKKANMTTEEEMLASKKTVTSKSSLKKKIKSLPNLPSHDNVSAILAPSTSSLLMTGDEPTTTVTSSWCIREEISDESLAKEVDASTENQPSLKKVFTPENQPSSKKVFTPENMPAKEKIMPLPNLLEPSTSSLLMVEDRGNTSLTSSWCRRDQSNTESIVEKASMTRDKQDASKKVVTPEKRLTKENIISLTNLSASENATTLPEPSTSSLLMAGNSENARLTSSLCRRDQSDVTESIVKKANMTRDEQVASEKVTTTKNRLAQKKITTLQTLPTTERVTNLPEPSTSSLSMAGNKKKTMLTSSRYRGDEPNVKKANMMVEDRPSSEFNPPSCGKLIPTKSQSILSKVKTAEKPVRNSDNWMHLSNTNVTGSIASTSQVPNGNQESLADENNAGRLGLHFQKLNTNTENPVAPFNQMGVAEENQAALLHSNSMPENSSFKDKSNPKTQEILQAMMEELSEIINRAFMKKQIDIGSPEDIFNALMSLTNTANVPSTFSVEDHQTLENPAVLGNQGRYVNLLPPQPVLSSSEEADQIHESPSSCVPTSLTKLQLNEITKILPGKPQSLAKKIDVTRKKSSAKSIMSTENPTALDDKAATASANLEPTVRSIMMPENSELRLHPDVANPKNPPVPINQSVLTPENPSFLLPDPILGKSSAHYNQADSASTSENGAATIRYNMIPEHPDALLHSSQVASESPPSDKSNKMGNPSTLLDQAELTVPQQSSSGFVKPPETKRAGSSNGEPPYEPDTSAFHTKYEELRWREHGRPGRIFCLDARVNKIPEHRVKFMRISPRTALIKDSKQYITTYVVMAGRLYVNAHSKYKTGVGKGDTFIVPPNTSLTFENKTGDIAEVFFFKKKIDPDNI